MNTTNTFDIENMIAQQSQSNPKMKFLLDMMKQQKQTAPENNAKTKGQLKKLTLINQKLIRRNKLLKRQQKKILKYLNFFIDVNTVFSSAVGACECWGEDTSCKECHGKGSPGFFQVNENAFKAYVMPCMEHITEKPKEVQSAEQVGLNNLSNN